MKFSKSVLTCLLVLLVLSCQSQKAVYDKPIKQAIELTNDFIAKNQIPGLAITVSVKGENVLSKGFGYGNLEAQTKVDPAKTKFRIGSISKPVSADALIQLWAQNKLQLDSSIQYYLPYFPKKQGKITSRMVAGHLAGIRHYNGNEFLSAKHFDNIDDALEIFENDPLISYPGKEYHYSSYGWNLLSRIVEKASGEEFLSYMQKHVFNPLEMHNTIADHTDSIIVNRTGFYQRTNDNRIVNGPFVDNSIKWAGGGFLSTSEDIMRFAKAHCKAGYLSQKQIDELTRSQETTKGKVTEYGIGWASGKDHKGHYYYGHSGGSIGATTHMIIYPKEEVCVVVLTNLSNVRFLNFSHEIANLFMK
ncbi:serine hydrolase [Marinifilum sp. D714]|uniref:serine hydrolase domain-containing protein n=1 Tax=Marinifilum sp. D714 TaxID=2937523 RepID=UPI0027CEAC38|nr:serine hydrolase domain-containing protein [Marinifilum sp. D714]MDQ2179315.1 beta-lactamase family protein [Marinifilum sp. D714]